MEHRRTLSAKSHTGRERRTVDRAAGATFEKHANFTVAQDKFDIPAQAKKTQRGERER